MKDWKQTSTRKAFGIHLALSILIFSSLVLTMLFFWFPGELFLLDGGWQGLKIVALIDLVLGPALTLILFKPGKKSLVFDMSVVAAFQIAALSYGFYATYQQRTVAVVHTEEGFNTLSASAYRYANQTLLEKEKTPKAIKEFASGYPGFLGTVLPTRENYGQYMADLLNDFPQPHERSDKFRTIDASLEDIAKNAMTIDEIEVYPFAANIKAALAKSNRTLEDTNVVRYFARYSNGVALFDPAQKKIIDYVPNANHKATETAEAPE